MDQSPPQPSQKLTAASTRFPRFERERKRPVPTSKRALKTYNGLLNAARHLLDEVGFERLTTNDICMRAEVTPPALYYYFTDKYDILEEIAYDLLNRQNDALFAWLFNGGAWVVGGAWPLEDQASRSVAEWYRIAADIVANEPGAVWTMRAIRALPNLANVRLASQRMLTDRLFELYEPLVDDVDRDLLWRRLRILVEFGYMVDELFLEENRIEPEILFEEAARLVSNFR